MSGATVDDLASLVEPAACHEVKQLMAELVPEDLTGCELLTVLTALRCAYERKLTESIPPAQLSVIRTARRRRKAPLA